MRDLVEYSAWIMPLFFAVGIASIAYRVFVNVSALRARGCGIRPALPDNALFGETGASGHSEASLLTKYSGASRCLLVSVTRERMAVELMFPFNLLVAASSIALDEPVPIRAITNAWQVDERSVRVSFDDPQRQSRTLRLYLKRPDAFVAALKSLKVKSIAPLEGMRR